MPYKTVAELPDQFAKLPDGAKAIAMNVINSVLEKGDSEESAFKQAWGAVKKSYKKDDTTGEWTKLDEALETVDISDVEILAVGTWHGYPADSTYTKKTLSDIVKSFKALTAMEGMNYEPPAKLGHDENQKLLQKDGYPAAGWVSKLKVVGDKLVADFKGVPKKIGDIINARGYKKVSSEIYFDKEMGGVKWPSILKAVAFLGGDIPAVKSLDDIAACYGAPAEEGERVVVYSEKETTLEDVVAGLDSWLLSAETWVKGRKGAPVIRTFLKEVKARLRGYMDAPVLNEESLDQKTTRIRDAFWSVMEDNNLGPKAHSYVRDVYPGYIIVDKDGELYQLPYTDTGDQVAFAWEKAVKVILSYQPVAAPQAGGDGTATENTEKGEEAMSKEVREFLGLKETDNLLDAVKALKAKAETVVSLAELDSVKADNKKLTTTLAERDRDARVGKAMTSGKVTPAMKPWADAYALSDPSGFDTFMATAPVIVKLGENGSGEGAHDEPAKLTEAEEKVAKGMGVDTEAHRKAIVEVKKQEGK